MSPRCVSGIQLLRSIKSGKSSLTLSFALSACATYQPLPLDTHVHLKHKLSELAHSGVRIDQPLSVYDVAVLAVENNPDLIATRTQRGVARAQVLEAGLLPNPSISASYLFLLNPDAAAGVIFDAVAASKKREAWSVTEFADSVLRLNPKNGKFTEYLLPQETNGRRAFVDSSTTPVTFWVGNTHRASIVKVEPLDALE